MKGRVVQKKLQGLPQPLRHPPGTAPPPHPSPAPLPPQSTASPPLPSAPGGFVRVNYTSGIAGIGYLGYPVAMGWDKPGTGLEEISPAAAVMVHELGHNFGRNHSPCGNVSGVDPNYPYPNAFIGTWGYDRRNGTLKDPSIYHDFMSYCRPQWVSGYTYERVQAFLEANPPQAHSLAPMGLREAVLLFTALVVDGEVRLKPPLLGPFRPEGRPSPYRLEVDGVSYPVYLLEDSEGGPPPGGRGARGELPPGGPIRGEPAPRREDRPPSPPGHAPG